jgi:hypothetical protein
LAIAWQLAEMAEKTAVGKDGFHTGQKVFADLVIVAFG